MLQMGNLWVIVEKEIENFMQQMQNFKWSQNVDKFIVDFTTMMFGKDIWDRFEIERKYKLEE